MSVSGFLMENPRVRMMPVVCSTTLFGSLAVMIHTHWELLSYWIGKLGDVNVPDGPCRFDPQVFTATNIRGT